MATTPLANLGIALLLAGGPLAAQTPAAPPAVDPALPDRLKELKDLVKDRKMTQDFQAIGLMQNLAKDLDKNPKDLSKLADALGEVFFTGKLREGPADILYREAADVLARLKEDGAKELTKAANHKRFKDNLALRAHLMLATGKTEDEKQIDWLVETVTRAPQDELRAAAGEALGNFKKAKVATQREIVKEMIRAWGSLDSLATQPVQTDPNAPVDFNPQNARQTLRVVEGKWVATLQKLTGVSHSKFAEWQHWLNKNPRWDPPQ